MSLLWDSNASSMPQVLGAGSVPAPEPGSGFSQVDTADGFILGATGSGVNQGMTASVDVAKETGKTASKLNNPWTRNYANDWITSNGADAISIGLDQKMSPEEKAQKMMPSLPRRSLKLVATETESKTASTATPASISRSCSGMPSFS